MSDPKRDKNNTGSTRFQCHTPLWPRHMFPSTCPVSSLSVHHLWVAWSLLCSQLFLPTEFKYSTFTVRLCCHWQSIVVQNVRIVHNYINLEVNIHFFFKVFETVDEDSVGLFDSQGTKTLHLPPLQCNVMWAWLTRRAVTPPPTIRSPYWLESGSHTWGSPHYKF